MIFFLYYGHLLYQKDDLLVYFCIVFLGLSLDHWILQFSLLKYLMQFISLKNEKK